MLRTKLFFTVAMVHHRLDKYGLFSGSDLLPQYLYPLSTPGYLGLALCGIVATKQNQGLSESMRCSQRLVLLLCSLHEGNRDSQSSVQLVLLQVFPVPVLGHRSSTQVWGLMRVVVQRLFGASIFPSVAHDSACTNQMATR